MKCLKHFLAVYPVKYRWYIAALLTGYTIVASLSARAHEPGWITFCTILVTGWLSIMEMICDTYLFGTTLVRHPVERLTYLKTSPHDMEIYRNILYGEMFFRLLTHTIILVVSQVTSHLAWIGVPSLYGESGSDPGYYVFLWVFGYGISMLLVFLDRCMDHPGLSRIVGVMVMTAFILWAAVYWGTNEPEYFAMIFWIALAALIVAVRMIRKGMEKKKEEYYDT